HPDVDAGPVRQRGARDACLRRHLVLPVARAAPAGERRSDAVATRGRRRARAVVEGVRAGSREDRGLRPSVAAPRVGAGTALGKWKLVPAARPPVPDTWGFAARIP